MDTQGIYFCSFENCGKSFKAKKSLTEHLRIHNGEKPYQCHIPGCGQRFTQYSSMQKHERTHTGDRPYKCEVCGRTFTQLSNLNRHEKVHSFGSVYKCEVCETKFSNLRKFERHMQLCAGKDIREKYYCKICKKMYLNRSSLRKHLLEHEDELIATVNESFMTKETTNTTASVKSESNMSKNATIVVPDDGDEESSLFLERKASKFVVIEPHVGIKSSPNTNQTNFGPELDLAQLHQQQQLLREPSAFVFSTGFEEFSAIPDSPSHDDFGFGDIEHFPLTCCEKHKTLESMTGPCLSSSESNNFKGVVRYKGAIYHLSNDGYLSYKNSNGETVDKQVDNDAVNPSRSHRLAAVSHYSDYRSLFTAYTDIVKHYSKCLTLDMLLSEKNCNSLVCNCGPGYKGCGKCDCCSSEEAHELETTTASEGNTHRHLEELDECPLEDDFCNKLKIQKKGGHLCLCKITRKFRHVHGDNCGHPKIVHDGHIDYIVDGKLHHHDSDHCDDHGPICFVETTSEDYAISMIMSGALPECRV